MFLSRRAEMMVKAYMTSYKLPCIITRGNNVYGPHQFPEKLVPKFTLLAKRGEPLPVHGGGQVRHAAPAPPPSQPPPALH
jgi:dTDP-D-glucose 4,6-dehydratase